MTHFWATVRAMRLLKVFGLMAEPERLCADDASFSKHHTEGTAERQRRSPKLLNRRISLSCNSPV